MAKLIDLTGRRYGKLVVLSRADDKILPSGYKTVMWNCICDCGNTTVVSGKNLNKKITPTRSCGCGMNQIRNNLVGQKFGRLTVIEKVKGKILKSGYEQQTYKCICDCGNETVVSYSALMSGNTTSCGCYFKEALIKRNTTHGKSHTKLYDVWKEMRYRCLKPSDKSYKYYGQKGIKICEEWDNDYQKFYDWAIESGYEDGLEIDRIDSDGDYCPENCRWFTRKQQMNNVSNNRIITINGVSKTLSQWCEFLGANYKLAGERILRGWDSVSALTAPKNYEYKKRGRFNGRKELFREIV